MLHRRRRVGNVDLSSLLFHIPQIDSLISPPPSVPVSTRPISSIRSAMSPMSALPRCCLTIFTPDANQSVISLVLSSRTSALPKVVAEDGSILAPPHLKIAPWADEEGLSLTDYKTGRARVVTPDKRAALTLRCLPLPVQVARLIEAHPNEVVSPVLLRCLSIASDKVTGNPVVSMASEADVCEDPPSLVHDVTARIVMLICKFTTFEKS